VIFYKIPGVPECKTKVLNLDMLPQYIIKFRILFTAVSLLLIVACKNSVHEIPFPADETGFSQPVAQPVQFSAAKKIKWPEKISHFKLQRRKFDFARLPARIFDSTGFIPFSKSPETVPFHMDSLKETLFNYDKLPTKRLKSETSILEQPKLIKVHLHLVNSALGLLYEFGEPLIGESVTCLFKDKTGFLWIATRQGLYRYDGENLAFIISGSIAHDVFTMTEDRYGRIWVGSQGNGIIVLDERAGIFNHLTISQGLASNDVGEMLIDRTGRVWVSESAREFAKGVEIIDEDSLTIKHVGPAEGLSSKYTYGMMQDNQDNIWIASWDAGINIFDLQNGKIKYLDKTHGLSTNAVIGILQDKMNKIWISGVGGEINSVDLQQGIITHYYAEQGLKKDRKFELLSDHKGLIWIGTNGNGSGAPGKGIEILDTLKGALKVISTASGIRSNTIKGFVGDSHGQIWIATAGGLNMVKNDDNIEHVGKSEISSLLEDHLGKIWIGTGNEGIEILDMSSNWVKSLNTQHGLSSDTVQNIIEVNGKIWISSTGGIDMIDSARRSLKHLGMDQGLTTDSLGNVFIDKAGRLWIALFQAPYGIDLLDPDKGTIQHLGKDQGLEPGLIMDIRQDHAGMIWIAFYSGAIAMIDPVNGTISYLSNAIMPGGNSIKILHPDQQGNMWIGISQGIYIINSTHDSLIKFTTNEGLISNNIISLNQYDGHIYAGTDGGLTIITYPSFLSQRTWQVESFGKDQGISKLVNSYASDCITKKGQFLWGDLGITILNSPEKNKSVQEIYITGLDVFNQPQYFTGKPANVLHSHPENAEWDSVTIPYNIPVNLRLPYDNNNLQFHFVQAHLGSQDTTLYRYILEGTDKKWSEVSLNSFSQNYSNLPAGDFIFKVSAKERKGSWATPADFKFSIMSPWWATWWAYALFAFLFIAIIMGFVNYRARTLRRENRILEERVTQRTNELKGEKEKVETTLAELKSTQSQLIQSEKMASLGELTAGIAHEIQNPLNFVNNFSEINAELIDEMGKEIDKGNLMDVKTIAMDIKENEQKIVHHGKRADAIVKGMLQHSRASTGQKEHTDINALADEYLRLSYHGLRAKDKSFNATLQTDFDPTIGKTNIIPQDIGRVLLNLYNNAFYAVQEKKKKLPEGYEPIVSIRTRKMADKIEIGVRDNGNGIPQKVIDKIFLPFFTTKPTGQGTGLGLSMSYDIVKAHGGEIRVDTREGEFTEFVVQIPAV
jgi:signal transduction histidine kinase/ligand-binding sensor domain-containing protein